jgi:SNARE associated Golgi protein
VLYARILPAMPYSLVNYAAGLTRVRLTVFAAATAIGCAPRAFAYAALGGSLDDLGSPEAIVALCVLVGMAAAGLVVASRDLRTRKRLSSSGDRKRPPAESELSSSGDRKRPPADDVTRSGSGRGSSSPDGRSAARP